MKILYFDCFAGISGDMAVGALLSAGLPLSHLASELGKLELSGYELREAILERSGISARKFDVLLTAQNQLGDSGMTTSAHAVRQPHSSEHDVVHHHGSMDHYAQHEHNDSDHTHSHNANHDHAAESSHFDAFETHLHDHGHSYSHIVGLIAGSTLSEFVKLRAIAIFSEIARGEAVVHGMPIERVHFHEVGAVDSIVDIVSVAIGLEYFGVEECRSRPVPLGTGGFIRTAHGIMPVPTPATVEILKGYPTQPGLVETEMTTPTGAGIIRALSRGEHDPGLSFTVTHVGYGAGTKSFAEVPNLLRIEIGDVAASSTGGSFAESDTVVQVTTAIDDMTPEMLAHLHEELLRISLDVYLRPIYMKKGRAATEIVILSAPGSESIVLDHLSRESTTIGVRMERIERRLHPREIFIIEDEVYGRLRFKKLILSETETRIEPEFEEVKRIAREHGLSIRDSFERLLRIRDQYVRIRSA